MKQKIFIVDDDEKNVALLSLKLEREGYDTAVASNGVEALEKIPAFMPDLVLMDVTMPVMDGHEALRRLKAREDTRFIPVIMLTGRADIEDKLSGFEAGAEDYISKPYSLLDVAARVKSLLRVRTLQTKLRDTEKLAALGEMVDGIAHEIRNPLTTIGGMARRLLEWETDPQHRAYAQRIIGSVERLERMLLRIDEYKRILTSTLAPGDLNAVLIEAVADLKDLIEGKEIGVSLDLAPDAPQIELDRKNMKIAVFNMLQNSVEAIEANGSIIVRTKGTDGLLVLSIIDTGCGIEKDEMRTIFYPFHTTKMQRAGLGLTISYRIMQDHGAEVEAESVKGSGTTFTIKFKTVLPGYGAARA